jgi:hypothetical protein
MKFDIAATGSCFQDLLMIVKSHSKEQRSAFRIHCERDHEEMITVPFVEHGTNVMKKGRDGAAGQQENGLLLWWRMKNEE